MSIVQRWFLKEFLWNFGRVAVVLFVISALTYFPSLYGKLTEPDGTLGQCISSIGIFIVLVIDSILPFSFLIGTLFTVSSMKKNNELSGASASGFSLWQITWPAILVSLIGAGFSLMLRLVGLTSGSGGPGGNSDELFTTAAACKTEFYHTLSYPFLNVLSFLAALLLVLKGTKKNKFGRFIPAVFLFFSYHIVSSGVLVLGKSGNIPPITAGCGVSVLSAAALWVFWNRSS